MDRLHEAAPQLSPRRLHLLARGEEEPPGHRRPQRRRLASLRQGWNEATSSPPPARACLGPGST
jgi:hypothetical protein